MPVHNETPVRFDSLQDLFPKEHARLLVKVKEAICMQVASLWTLNPLGRNCPLLLSVSAGLVPDYFSLR